MELTFVYREVEKGWKNEWLNAEAWEDCIVDVRCTGLNYKSPTLSKEDGAKVLLH